MLPKNAWEGTAYKVDAWSFLNINGAQRVEKLKRSWTVYLCDSPFYIKPGCLLPGTLAVMQ